MKTLLLCGYRAQDRDESTHAAEIDARIEELRDLKTEVICVLSGEADDLLRESKRIHDVEIVYDTSDSPTLFSNARAGVFAAIDEAVFVLPFETPAPEKAVWDFLKNEHGKVGFATEHSFLRASDAAGSPHAYGFPLLLTRKGSKRIENSSDFVGFADPRLNSLALPFPA